VELRGLHSPLPENAPAETKQMLAAMGLEELLADCDLRYVHDPAARTLDIPEMTVSAEGLYRLTFDGAFQNVDPALEDGQGPRFQAAMRALTTTGMGLELEDQGLVDKLFTAYATMNGNPANAPLLRRIVTASPKIWPESFSGGGPGSAGTHPHLPGRPQTRGLRIHCPSPNPWPPSAKSPSTRRT
jgi:hypothetical protein